MEYQDTPKQGRQLHVEKSREVKIKMATDSLCLENIDEFVHDENKIVSVMPCLILYKVFCVHLRVERTENLPLHVLHFDRIFSCILSIVNVMIDRSITPNIECLPV